MGKVVTADDGLPAEVVGRWAIEEKHHLLKQYVEITRGVRRQFLGRAGATLIDLYCGWGRVSHRDTSQFHPGGCVCGYESSKVSGTPFTHVLINDLAKEKVEAAATRLRGVGASVLTSNITALEAASWAAEQVNPYGFHLAYVDPYDLEVMPFGIFESLAKLNRIDLMIHVSTQDLQRNFERYREQTAGPLDLFAPGWRARLDRSPQRRLRPAVLAHWLGLLGKLGFRHARSVRHVRSDHGQTLYHLYLLSRHPLADTLWNASERSRPQGDLFM